MTEKTGVKFIRGRQHSGSQDSPDIKPEAVTMPWSRVHFEVKGAEKLDLWAALEQASKDAGDLFPVVMHRVREKPFVITMPLGGFIMLIRMAFPVYVGGERV